jgi:Zn-dependent protease with chaperone function
MNPLPMLCIVLLATFGLSTLLLASLVALAWRAGLDRLLAAPADLLALRLFPATAGLLLALTVVLPAFCSYEPPQEHEAVGPLLMLLAAFALLTLGHGIWRGGRAYAMARSLLRNCGPPKRWVIENGRRVRVVDVAEPFIGVVGGWQPQVVSSECIVSACSADEFRQVIAHEAAHVSARDNLKLLLLLASPDALAWMPLGTALTERWRTAAEFAADQRAAGNDPHKRLALASALIKVARLFNAGEQARPALTMAVALDDVAGRVRRLLGPPQTVHASIAWGLAACALLLPVIALPLYAHVHELIELLVRFGL